MVKVVNEGRFNKKLDPKLSVALRDAIDRASETEEVTDYMIVCEFLIRAYEALNELVPDLYDESELERDTSEIMDIISTLEYINDAGSNMFESKHLSEDWDDYDDEYEDDYEDEDYDDSEFGDAIREINYKLSEFYDLCDNLGVFIPTFESKKQSSKSRVLEYDEKDSDIGEVDQEFTSAKTSINSSKLPALFKMSGFKPGKLNLDYGGGKFDNVAEYLDKEYGSTNLVYDPYNRTKDHNNEVIKQVKANKGADTITCSNVLNVIKEPEARANVIKNIKKLLKTGGTAYFTVYEGTGAGDSKETKSGYQQNRKTDTYIEEIDKVFSNVTKKGKLIIAR